jgi:translation elongation factor EF-1beta
MIAIYYSHSVIQPSSQDFDLTVIQASFYDYFPSTALQMLNTPIGFGLVLVVT